MPSRRDSNSPCYAGFGPCSGAEEAVFFCDGNSGWIIFNLAPGSLGSFHWGQPVTQPAVSTSGAGVILPHTEGFALFLAEGKVEWTLKALKVLNIMLN